MMLSELVEDKKTKKVGKDDKGTYAAFRFDKEDLTKIKKWAKDNEIPNLLSRSKMHCTLLYSREHCPNYKPLGKLSSPIKARPKGLDIFKTQSDNSALVLLLDSPAMCRRHEKLMKEHDATYDFDEYKPHITVSYDVGKDFNIDDLTPIKDSVDFIRAIEEHGKDLIEDWSKKV